LKNFGWTKKKLTKDFRWFLKINCGACGETTDWVYIDEEDTVEVKGGRGTAHMVLNCKVYFFILFLEFFSKFEFS